MKFYVLDAGGAGLVIGFLLVFMLAAIIIEAVAILIMKYNNAGKAFLDSLIINIISLSAGFVIITIFDTLDFTNNEIANLFILYLCTVVIEFLTLYLLNRSKPVQKTLTVSAVINIFSYIILFFFTR